MALNMDQIITKLRATVCVSCLSTDRKLYFIKVTDEFFSLCRELKLMEKDAICWECKAIFVKFHKFKMRTLDSYTQLQDSAKILRMLKEKAKIRIKYNTNSTLKSEIKHGYDYYYMETDESEIKVEREDALKDTIPNIDSKIREIEIDMSMSTFHDAFKSSLSIGEISDTKPTPISYKHKTKNQPNLKLPSRPEIDNSQLLRDHDYELKSTYEIKNGATSNSMVASDDDDDNYNYEDMTQIDAESVPDDHIEHNYVNTINTASVTQHNEHYKEQNDPIKVEPDDIHITCEPEEFINTFDDLIKVEEGTNETNQILLNDGDIESSIPQNKICVKPIAKINNDINNVKTMSNFSDARIKNCVVLLKKTYIHNQGKINKNRRVVKNRVAKKNKNVGKVKKVIYKRNARINNDVGTVKKNTFIKSVARADKKKVNVKKVSFQLDDSATETASSVYDEEENFIETDLDIITKSITLDQLLEYRKQELEELTKPKYNYDTPSKRYYCTYCIMKWNNKKIYENHFTLHHNMYYKYDCKICHRRFQLEAEHKMHYKTHFRYHTCRHCKFSNTRYAVVTTHWSNEHNIPKCDVCSLEFKTKSQWYGHQSRFHSNKPYRCKLCRHVFGREETLNKHMRIYHGPNNKLVCEVCGKEFNNSILLRKHMYKHKAATKSQNESKSQTTEYYSYCAQCDLQFYTKVAYNYHMTRSAKHGGTPRFECDYCGEKFFDKSTIEYHIDKNHMNISLKCQYCSLVINSRQSHKRHETRHVRKKPDKKFVCHMCGREFSNKQVLRDHINSHTNRRPHKCKQCSADFNYKSALFLHYKYVHSDNPKKIVIRKKKAVKDGKK